MPESDAAIALSAGALLLGVLCLALLVVALRRMLGRHEEIVATMLQRYDHRLAEFAQTLNDALNQTLPARITAAISGTPVDAPAVEAPDHSNVVRVLELAREQTAADAAVAIVGTKHEPILATVGLSQSEVAQVGGLGVPDYRGARAIQVSFNGDGAPRDSNPIRSGLAIPLLDSPNEPGMLARAHADAGSSIQRDRHHVPRERSQHHATRSRDLARAPRAGSRTRARRADRPLRPARIPCPSRA